MCIVYMYITFTVIFTPVLQNQGKKHFSPKRLGAATRSLRVVNFGFRLRF